MSNDCGVKECPNEYGDDGIYEVKIFRENWPPKLIFKKYICYEHSKKVKKVLKGEKDILLNTTVWSRKEVKIIEATTWDGKDKVLITIPKKPTKKQAKEIINYLLELDDHDGIDEFKRITGMTQKELEKLFK